MSLFSRFKCDLYDLCRSIALAELFDFFDLTKLQQYLFQLIESHSAGDVANYYLVDAERKRKILFIMNIKSLYRVAKFVGRTTCACVYHTEYDVLCHRADDANGMEPKDDEEYIQREGTDKPKMYTEYC